MKPYAFPPQASEEYSQPAQYYAAISPELGGRFYDEIEGLIAQLCEQPDRVWIVAVMHAKRRPDYWRERI